MAWYEGMVIGSAGEQNVIIFSDDHTSCDTISSGDHTKGLSGMNENRIFIYNHEDSKEFDVGDVTTSQAGIFNYSFRGDYTKFTVTTTPEGEDVIVNEQWFHLGTTNSEVFKILNIGGTLYIFKTSPYSGGLEVYRKESYYSDPEELIDSSSFTLIFQDPKVSIPSWRSITHIGGMIWLWVKNIGLCYLEGNNLVEVSNPITACNFNVAGYETAGEVTVIADERYKLILCYEPNADTTYVYDLVKRIWYNWSNIPLCALGFASSPSIFGTSDYCGVNKLGRFATSSDDITPTIKTGALNFGFPDDEKFLRRLTFDAKGITSISIYFRDDMRENFSLYQTVNNPENIINFPANLRFRDVVFEITGNGGLCIKSMSATFDVRRAYV